MRTTDLLSSLVPLLLLPLARADDAPLTSSKRGLCYVSDTKDAATDAKIWTTGDLTWYYNYAASPTAAFANTGLEFVPMQWGAPSSNTDMTFYNTVAQLIDAGTRIQYVLAFNEPDGCTAGGSCVDAATAAATWLREIEPLKTKYHVQLGAPAVTGSPTGFTWLQQFFTACAGNCSADFIPVHWYGDFKGLASHVGQVNATYPNMSMWVTEYADPSVTLEESQTFYNQSASWFERLDYVKRYSYFGAFRSSVSNVGPNAAFLTQKGELTDIGAWYLGKEETNHTPKGGAARAATFAGWAVAVLATMVYVGM